MTQLSSDAVQTAELFVLLETFEVQNAILENAAQQGDSVALLAQLHDGVQFLLFAAREAGVVPEELDQALESGALHCQLLHLVRVVTQVDVLAQELLTQLVEVTVGDRVQVEQVDERRVQLAYAVVLQHDHVGMRYVGATLFPIDAFLGVRPSVLLVVRLDQTEQQLLSVVRLFRFA